MWGKALRVTGNGCGFGEVNNLGADRAIGLQEGSYKELQIQISTFDNLVYEVCKLSNETGSVVFDLATLGEWDMEGRLGHNATKTFSKLQQAYGNSVLSRAQVFRWFKAFSEGRELIEDEPRSRRPSVSKTAENVVRLRDLVRSDRRLTNIPVAPQPPYSPDLSPCDFFLFPKLKNHLKGHHFGTLKNIQTAASDQLKAIRISEFRQCYEEWKKRLQRCVA
ncbi:putative mariner transposase [Trichonephila clavipes]|nr:putative mariner transposase [Trichonephila clavipes]